MNSEWIFISDCFYTTENISIKWNHNISIKCIAVIEDIDTLRILSMPFTIFQLMKLVPSYCHMYIKTYVNIIEKNILELWIFYKWHWWGLLPHTIMWCRQMSFYGTRCYLWHIMTPIVKSLTPLTNSLKVGGYGTFRTVLPLTDLYCLYIVNKSLTSLQQVSKKSLTSL